MAEDDLFVGEVNDDVRRDSMVNFLKKFKFVLVGIVIAVIAFVAFMEWRGSQSIKAGEAQSAAIAKAIAGEDGAKDALLALKSKSALSELMLGKVEQDAGNKDAALAAYQSVANNSSYSNSARELAKLRMFELDETYDGAALMNPDAPYEVEAKLIEAERRHANADQDGAVEIITGLLQNGRAQSITSILESTLIAWGVEVPDPLGVDGAQKLEETPVEK